MKTFITRVNRWVARQRLFSNYCSMITSLLC